MSTTPSKAIQLMTEDDDSVKEVYALVRRLELWPQLLLRQQQEQIASIVPIDNHRLQDRQHEFLQGESLNDFLSRKCWTTLDLTMHLHLPEALRIYANHRFGPDLEDFFLSSQGAYDQVVYSLLRVRDTGLARELWIRLEEGEASFSDLASTYGEGPEAARNGVIGPLPMGQIAPPELSSLLRSLQPGQVHPPRQLGEWLILLRLEQLTPARFDDDLRQLLLTQQLDEYLKKRVEQLMRGEQLENHYYNPVP